MKINFQYFFILLVLLSCSEREPLMTIDNVSNIVIADNGNSGDGSDIEVNFKKQIRTQDILEYRIMLIKYENADAFTKSTAASLDETLYESVTPSNIFPVKGLSFSADSRDTDGDIISPAQNYIAGVLTVVKDDDVFENAFDKNETSFTLSINSQISFRSRELSIPAGDLVLNENGDLIVASFDVISELSSPFQPLSIYRINTSGVADSIATSASNLGGNAINSKGTLYQSTLHQEKIMTMTQDGEISNFEFSGYGGFIPFIPDGIYIDEEDQIFVVDVRGQAIVKISKDGAASKFAELGPNPRGITRDDDGNFYVSHNDESGLISKITPDGAASTFANIPTQAPENYQLPYITWTGYIQYYDQKLYVPSICTDRIYELSLDGEVNVFAGSGTRGIPKGGVKTANLNRPMSITIDPQTETMYISSSADTNPLHVQSSSPSSILKIKLLE